MPSYCNPLFPDYFADPFVWKTEETWYAVGTDLWDDPSILQKSGQPPDGKTFPLLRSSDCIHWEKIGYALTKPDWAQHGMFWAPEVAFHQGRFYLYYSVSIGPTGLDHQLRVAVAERPEGPYCDIKALMADVSACPFAIDPHPFQDDDGSWYLFYSRDFLDLEDGYRVGTGIVVDRLHDMTHLAGSPVTVMRARYDWQLFRAQREMYGQIYDWHTLEGPCVRKHGSRYFCFYSGGCYENESYGVDYGAANHVLGPYNITGGKSGPRILRTIPRKVIGPGHNSIAPGPDGTDFIFYHSWDRLGGKRLFFMDRLIWSDSSPRSSGPTLSAQPI